MDDLFEHASPPVRSVSQLTRLIRMSLESGFPDVRVEGEVSNLRVPASGHCYFTLKDEGAQISAVIWKSAMRGLRVQLRNREVVDLDRPAIARRCHLRVVARCTVELAGNNQLENFLVPATVTKPFAIGSTRGC